MKRRGYFVLIFLLGLGGGMPLPARAGVPQVDPSTVVAMAADGPGQNQYSAQDYSPAAFSQYAENPGNTALQSLAASLGNDPLRIYEWVKNNVTTEFYVGCERGAYLTFLERAGNDADQCALLAALFKWADPNVSITYERALIALPLTGSGPNQIGVYDWLGVQDTESVLNFLTYQLAVSGTFASTAGVQFRQMGITASWPDNNTSATFFPAIKPHQVGLTADVGQLSGYSQSSLFSLASGTAGQFTTAVNSPGVRNYLTSLAMTASQAIHSSQTLRPLTGAGLAQLPVVVPSVLPGSIVSGSTYPQTLLAPFSSNVYNAMPGNFTAALHLQVGTFDQWLESPQLAGQPLTVQFDSSGTATIELGGTVLGTDSSGSASQNVTVTMQYETAPLLVADGNGNPIVMSGSRTVARQNAISVCYSFGSNVGRLQQLLQTVAAKEANSPSTATLSDHQQVIGQQYLSQIDESARLAAAACGCRALTFMKGAFVYQTDRPILDVQINDVFTLSPGDVPGGNRATGLIAGALEGAAMQQYTIQGDPNARAFGTPTLFDYAMGQAYSGAYLLNSSNFSSVVNQLQNFNDGALGANAVETIQDQISQGHEVVLLANSSVPYGTGAFGGYFVHIPSYGGVGCYIDSAAGGVSLTQNNGTAGSTADAKAASDNQTGASAGTPKTETTEPVDLTNGAYQFDATDLVLGQAEPKGLRLQRHYNSAMRLYDNVGLGRGWTHNYGISLASRSPTDIDARSAGADEVLPIVIAARVIQDVLDHEDSARAWMIASTAAAWAADQTIQSRAAVALGERTVEFIQMPDGTFAAPSDVDATLVTNSDKSHSLAFRHSNTIQFRASDGNFTAIADQYGNQLTASYTGTNGRLHTVTDCFGRSLTFTYDASGFLDNVTDSASRSVSFGFDSGTGIYTATDPEGKTESLYFDGLSRLTKVVDALNRTVVINGYDAWDRCISQQTFGDTAHTWKFGIAPGIGFEFDPLGKLKRSYFDPRGRRFCVVDAVGDTSTWGYDGADRLVSYVTPAGGTHTYAYDQNDVLIQETDPLNHSRTIVPDGQMRPWKVSDFNGQVTVNLYNSQNDVTLITAPGGIATAYGYDTLGRLISYQPPACSASIAYRNFDSFGMPQTVSYPNGFAETRNYDARGNLILLVDRAGAKTTYTYNLRNQPLFTYRWCKLNPGDSGFTGQLFSETTYDDAGNVASTLEGGETQGVNSAGNPAAVLSAGRQVEYDYDALGHLVAEKAGTAQITVLSDGYDARNLLTGTTDGMGHTTNFTYDAAGRLVSTTDPVGRATVQLSDADGNVVATQTPLGIVNSSTYDQADRRTEASDGIAKSTLYSYDADGRTITLTNRLSHAYSWTYDDPDRIVTLSTPQGNSQTTVSGVNGLPSEVTTGLNVTNFRSYDSEGRPTTVADTVGTKSYSYLSNGLLSQVSDAGKTSQRTYDEVNRLVSYTDNSGNQIQYSYYPDDRLKTLTYPGNKPVTYAYDDFGRLATVTDWAGRVTSYAYDNASRLTQISRPNGSVRKMGYYDDNRLKEINDYAADESLILNEFLEYDADGRIASIVLNPAPAAVTQPIDTISFDQDNRISNWNHLSVFADSDGNMTQGPLPNGTMGSYSFDARDRLTAAGGLSYGYGPDNQRVSVTSGGGTTAYVVDPNQALSRTLIRTKPDGTTTYYVYGLGLLYEDTAGSSTTYHFNHLGSTVALSPDNGRSVTDRVYYSTYGAVVAHIGPSDTPFLFDGQDGVITDTDGLNYMRARYYNPRIARFITADPIHFDAGTNWYAFAQGDPVAKNDPAGFDAVIHLTSGATVTVTTTKQFIDTVNAAATGAIAGINFPAAHGSQFSQNISRDLPGSDYVKYIPYGGYVFVGNSSYSSGEILTQANFGSKMASGSYISYEGCDTAAGSDNIALETSLAFSGITVTGNSTVSTGVTNGKPDFAGSEAWGGNPISYLDGKVVSLDPRSGDKAVPAPNSSSRSWWQELWSAVAGQKGTNPKP